MDQHFGNPNTFSVRRAGALKYLSAGQREVGVGALPGPGGRLGKFLAHDRDHRFVAGDSAIRRFLVPGSRFAAGDDVAEACIECAWPWLVLIEAQLGQGEAASADPLLQGLDEDRSNATGTQWRIDRESCHRTAIPEGLA